MSELDDIKVDDWLAFVSTTKASDPVLQQVITVTVGLVKTKNYTFREGWPRILQSLQESEPTSGNRDREMIVEADRQSANPA